MQKTVCDVCGRDVTEADNEPVDYREARLHLTAGIHTAGAWKTADICAVCLHGASKKHDKSPQVAVRPYGSLRWLVYLKGVKSPGPHAGFEYEDMARKFAADWEPGAEVRQA